MCIRDRYNAFVGACVGALRRARISTLRFNFSTPDGAGDDMDELLEANVAELSAAVHTLAAAQPHAPLVLLGYSWGALVALAAARRETTRSAAARVSALALIAPPINMVPAALQPARGDFARYPMLLLAGEDDEYCSTERLAQIAGDAACTLVPLAGVGHFLQGAAAERAAQHAVEWVRALDMR